MMNGTSAHQNLLEIVTATARTTISEVIDVMQSIDGVLPNNDGLKWFNLLYLTVTTEIHDHPPADGWRDVLWITKLDVVFANFYFAAIANFLSQRTGTPSSWQALFETRYRAGIDRIQFALAGMNAHINHDLSLALLQTNAELQRIPLPKGPEHDDFEHINDILEAVLPRALAFLATGILGEVVQDTGKIGRLLAIWNVRVARDLAWDFADHLRHLTGLARNIALRAQDKLTGALGRGLLLPLQ
jgi:Family of unknown function (DUF5995)